MCQNWDELVFIVYNSFNLPSFSSVKSLVQQFVADILGFLRLGCTCISQITVAKALGYNSSQIVSNWERGICLPPFKSLKLLCKLYQISQNEMTKMLMNDYERKIHQHL